MYECFEVCGCGGSVKRPYEMIKIASIKSFRMVSVCIKRIKFRIGKVYITKIFPDHYFVQ
jgi:hypothetical protein